MTGLNRDAPTDRGGGGTEPPADVSCAANRGAASAKPSPHASPPSLAGRWDRGREGRPWRGEGAEGRRDGGSEVGDTNIDMEEPCATVECQQPALITG